MHFSILLLATLFVLPQSLAQQSPDGRIVPFKSSLPSCASQCGPLYDVEGGCKDKTCFCADPRLQAFRQVGNAGASSICGAASCTAATDLEALKTWYNSFCGSTAPEPTATTTGSGAVSTKGSAAASGNSGGGSDTWFARHTRWVIMIIIIVVGLILLWVGAWYFRRRYLRKKEREIEMSPPVAWGPPQVQGATGGYQYGDGVVDASRGGPVGATGGHHKEMASAIPSSGKRLSKSKMGWFKANR